MTTTDMAGHYGRHGAPLDGADGRLVAFRKAQRHTRHVRLLKTALPVAAMLTLAVYGALVYLVVGWRPKNFDPGTMHISSENLVMENPKYDGFGRDGTRYAIHAKNAVTDLKMAGPIRLNEIDGDLLQQSGVITHIKANWGTFDQKKNELELYEKIDIDGSTGMKARLTRATVHTKDNHVVSNEPVTAEMTTGTVRGDTMELNSKTRRVSFRGNVAVHMKSNPATAKAGGGAAASKPAAPMPGLQLNSGAPIDVTSATLDVDDNAKTALFRDNVIARQAESTLMAPEMDVLYEGKAETAVAGAAPEAKSATRLKLLKARGGVVMTQKENRATAATLDYDAATERALLQGDVVMTAANDRRATSANAQFDRVADTALLTGDVVITQGKNIMKGQRLFVEHKEGHTRLETPAGRIAATFYRTDPKPGDAAAAKGKPEPKAEAAKDALSLGPSFKTDPKAPIDVDAETLDVFDPKKSAVFKGSVIAKQGDFVVRSAEMTVRYTGQSGLGMAPAAQTGTKETAQLTKIEARQKVVITSTDGRTVTGDWADFDVKSNQAVVGGKVVVTQGKNVVEGTKLLIDLNTGQSHFEVAETAAAAAGAAAGAAVTPCGEGQVCSKRRIRAVFYPKDVEAAKKKVEGRSTAGSGSKQPSTSSWQSMTRSPGAE